MNDASSKAGSLLESILPPLALAQFICSYAGSINLLAILLPPDQAVRSSEKGAENDAA